MSALFLRARTCGLCRKASVVKALYIPDGVRFGTVKLKQLLDKDNWDLDEPNPMVSADGGTVSMARFAPREEWHRRAREPPQYHGRLC